MRPLSILFTNNTLSLRAGSELWVRDVCRSLVGRGHRPVAFSLVTGPVADELRAATVPVVSNLDDLGFTPDLIHGHHHIETLIAALQFPDVPIVHFCHGWLPWEEGPLRHPAIARYVGVDETCVDRLTAESGISPDQVDRLLNFVDLSRFVPRGPLPPRPRRALIFSNGAHESGYASIIREACRESSIEVELAGVGSGRVVEYPETLLPDFDLVFAKARSALEAVAVGCSVIVADVVGAGPLVTERDVEHMRACNFGVRLLQHPHSVDWYRAQIAAYDASDASRVSEHVRRDADMEVAVDRLLEIYERALTEYQRNRSADSAAVRSADNQRAAARHLSAVALRFKGAYALERSVNVLSGELSAARDHQEQVQRLNDQLSTELLASRAYRDDERRLNKQLSTELEAAHGDHDHTRRLNEDLRGEVEVLRSTVGKYRDLASLRIRDALIRVPVVGAAARRAARLFKPAPRR